MWFLLALLAGLLFAINKLIFRAVFTKQQINPIFFLAMHDGLAGLLLLPLALINTDLPKSTPVWLAFLLGVVLIFVANYYAALALKHTEASVFQIVGQSRHIVVLFGAALLFSEPISSIKIFSIFLIILGVIIALKQGSKIRITKGVIYSFLSTIAIGCAFLFIKIANQDVAPVFLASVALIISGLLSYLITLFMNKNDSSFKLPVKLRTPLVVAALIFAIFELVIFTALSIGEASRVTPVSQSSMIFTIVGAYLFLDERNHLKQKIIGGTIIALGIIVLYFL